MKKLLLSIYLLVSLASVGQAIKFGRFGTGFTGEVRELFYDTIGKKLYAAGTFNLTGDNLSVWGVSVWNGQKWDTLQGGFTQTPHVYPGGGSAETITWAAIRFQNKIYFSGGIVWVNGHNQYNMAVWDVNSQKWDYPIAEPPNTLIFDFKVHNNILYACGMFGKFGNTTCNYVAKFDGVSWQPVGNFKKFSKLSNPAQVNAIEFYNGELYLGGAFDDSTGTPQNIAKFDGTNWVTVGPGIKQGGINSVFALQTFNNKLYIGGRFGKTNEVPQGHLITWNGANFNIASSVDLVVDGQINTLRANKNNLFVTGAFVNSGPYINNYIFYLDTNQACIINGLQSTFDTGGIGRCELINDSLVVGGTFLSLDTVNAKFVGVITNYTNSSTCYITGIKENNALNDFIKVYPNPTKNKITIENSQNISDLKKISLLNLLGQTIYISEESKEKYEINLEALPSAIYYLKIEGVGINKVVKILKE